MLGIGVVNYLRNTIVILRDKENLRTNSIILNEGDLEKVDLVFKGLKPVNFPVISYEERGKFMISSLTVTPRKFKRDMKKQKMTRAIVEMDEYLIKIQQLILIEQPTDGSIKILEALKGKNNV